MSGPSLPNEHLDDADDAPVAELVHDAGLTAGHTLGLRPGRFRLGPRRSSEGGLVTGAPDVVSFDLAIADDGATSLSVGREPVAVEGIVVDESVDLDDGDVIQLTSDHFVLRVVDGRTTRPTGLPVSPRSVAVAERPVLSTWLWFFGALTVAGLVAGFFRTPLFGLALIGVGGIVATLAVGRRLHAKRQQEERRQRDNARRLFFSEIVDVRRAASDERRSPAFTPSQVVAMSERSPQSGAALITTIASGDQSWEPPVVCHRDPGWDHQAVVDELSFLPAIPFSVDLDAGPIAVCGPRSATLAVARHLITSAQVLARIPIQVGTSVPADWRWLRDVATEGAPLRVFDETVGARDPRSIHLAPSVDVLDTAGDFATVMVITDDGRASIVHRGTVIGDGFVPHGVTDQHAAELQQRLSRSPIDAAAGPAPQSATTLTSAETGDRPDSAGGSDDADVVVDLREPTIDLRTSAASITPARPLLSADVAAAFDGPSLEQLDSDRLLVTGLSHARNKNVLASAALRQAARFPDREIYILDRGDRALIRLAQLDGCEAYASIDQIDRVIELIAAIEQRTSDPDRQVLLLAPDLWATTSFYRNSGFGEVADAIDSLVDSMDLVPMAASAPSSADLPLSSFLVWVDTNDPPRTASPVDADRTDPLDLSTLPGLDLTGSVARLVRNQELPS